MRTAKREDTKRVNMSYIEIFQIVFLIVVFVVGVIGFIKAATNDDKKS